MSTKRDIKATFKHALVFSGAGMVSKAIGFIMLPVYAHYLRGEGYGILGMVDVILSVLATLIGYGITLGMQKLYFERVSEAQRARLVSTSVLVMFFLVILVSSPSFLAANWIAKLAFGNAEYSYYVVIAILSFIFDMTGKAGESYILIQQRSVFLSILGLIKLSIGLFFNIYLIVFLNMGVLGYLYSSLICAGLYSFVMHLYAIRNVGLHFARQDARDILKFSLPLIPGSIAMFIKNNANRVILRSYMGLTQLGTFEMVFKFATLIGLLVMVPFDKIWTVKRFEICDVEGGPESMARVFTLYLSALLLLGLVLSLEVPLCLKILTPREFWVGSLIVVLAILSRILIASYYHIFFGILYSKKTHLMSLIQVVATVVNVVGSLVLIRKFGLLGAVLVSCITSLSQCVLGYYWGQKYYHIPYEWKNILKMIGMACLLFFLINQISVEALSIGPWLNRNLVPVTRPIFNFLHLNSIKDGKLVAYLLGNVPLVVEGGIKFILSLLFIPGLVFLDIIPKTFASRVFCFQTLKNPGRIFS